MIARWVVVSLLSVCVALVLSCGPQEGRAPDQEQAPLKRKIRKTRRKLIRKYDPIVFPSRVFSKRKLITYDLQKLLITEERRPVLFAGFFDDITEEDGEFEIHFSSTFSYGPVLSLLDKRRVRFHLTSDQESVQSILDNPPDLDTFYSRLLSGQKDFFVVCRVESVRKIINYAVEGYPRNEEEKRLRAPDIFIVEGELLEMVKYPLREK
jgi:hypothetical protein